MSTSSSAGRSFTAPSPSSSCWSTSELPPLSGSPGHGSDSVSRRRWLSRCLLPFCSSRPGAVCKLWRTAAFGARPSKYEAVAEFGVTLEQAAEPTELLPQLVETIQRAIRLTWAQAILDDGTPSRSRTSGRRAGSASASRGR